LNALTPNANQEDWLINHADLEFTKELGSGTSGKVYKGIFQNTKVAIKVLKAKTAETIEEFKKEYHVMSIVQSPYITRFFGACLEPKICMVMEYCAKGSLFHYLNNEDTQLGWDRTLKFAIEMTIALDCLHTWSPPIFHRDVKSPNFLIHEDWHVKLCDFGLARFNTTGSRDTMGKMCGTFAYVAPEMINQTQPYTAKCDIYSLGIIFWEMAYRAVNGKYQAPFQEYSDIKMDFQVIFKASEENVRPTIPKKCHPGFATLVNRCWAKDPAQRPATPEILDFLNELEKDFRYDSAKWNGLIVAP